MILLFLFLFVGTAQAEGWPDAPAVKYMNGEYHHLPVPQSPPKKSVEVCTDRDEFVHFAQRYQLLEKRDKAQSESIKALVEKDKAWQQYKASAEPLLAEYASRLEDSIKREEVLIARNEHLEAQAAEQKKMEWVEKTEVAGTAVAVALTARWGGKHLWRWGKALVGK